MSRHHLPPRGLSDEPPRKKPRMHSSEAETSQSNASHVTFSGPPFGVYFPLFKAMYLHLWGKPENLKDIRFSNESGDREYLDLGYYGLSVLPGPLRLCDGKIYIRECYKKLRGIQRNRIVLTGTPGIGKSIYLWYHLIHRMSEAKPCVWVRDASFVIDENGIKTITTPVTSFNPDVWLYLDYEQIMVDIIPDHFSDNMDTVAGAIMSTPPIEDRWRSLRKYGGWVVLLMPPWDNEELLFTARTIYGTDGRTTNKYISTLIHKFGTAPQTVFLILSGFSTEYEEWIDIIGARALPRPDNYAGFYMDFSRKKAKREGARLGYHDLFELSPHPHDLENTPSSPDFPRFYGSVAGFRSRDVLKACLATHRKLERNEAVSWYLLLHYLEEFPGIIGNMFELLAQIHLSCGGTFSSCTLSSGENTKDSLQSTFSSTASGVASPLLSLPDSQDAIRQRLDGRPSGDIELSQAGDDPETFSLDDVRIRFANYPECDYIGELQVPCMSNWSTSDFFVVMANDQVVLFRCTVGKPRPIQTSVLEHLLEFLPPCLYPTIDRKWIFCFVMPMDTSIEPALAPQSLVSLESSTSKHAAIETWDDLIEQRWLTFDEYMLFSS